MTGRRKAAHERIRRWIQVVLIALCSHVGLAVVVVAYSIGGAFLFEMLEAGRELDQRLHIQRFRHKCLAELWRLSEFENHVVTATKLDGYDGKEANDVERQWSFSGSLLYSITVITTIGYGNLTPRTSIGKLVTMLYALIGIPLMLLFLSNIGTSMANAFQFAFAQICCSLDCGPRRRRKLPTLSPVVVPVAMKTDPVAGRNPVEGVKGSVTSLAGAHRPLKPVHRVGTPLIDVRDLADFDYDIIDPPLPVADQYVI